METIFIKSKNKNKAFPPKIQTSYDTAHKKENNLLLSHMTKPVNFFPATTLIIIFLLDWSHHMNL